MKILFPTDYSKNACNAFQFACYLAEKMDASITLLHTYQIPITRTQVPAATMAHSIQELKHTQQKKLKDFVEDFKIHATTLPLDQIAMNYESETGELLEVIKDLAIEEDFDMIIMGTKGATNSKEAQFGSNTSKIIDNVSIPVLAVPAEANYQGFSKVALAEDFDDNDTEPIEFIKNIKKLFGAHLSIVHIAEVEDNSNPTRMRNYNDIKHRSIRTLPDTDIEIIHGFDKVLALDDFMEEQKVDLLAMVGRDRSEEDFPQPKRLINEMVLHTQTPLIVFPKS